jgi:hypothetical protein
MRKGALGDLQAGGCWFEPSGTGIARLFLSIRETAEPAEQAQAHTVEPMQ